MTNGADQNGALVLPPALVLRDLAKSFGSTPAVDGVNLEVRSGEFVTLLGPSGSGKTTTLRVIAGLTTQSRGTVEIGGVDVTGFPPYRRNVGMIFQNYALFPHMTAAQNVAFPLEMRGVSRQMIEQQVANALALVRLENLGQRYPRQLSGGQQQRIALARAVVFNPRLLLMDEPLGALDKKLRDALQLELMRISRELHATVIYVTHDQEEALILSDRIAIFRKGRIEQLGTGADLYDRPLTLFVADFIGEANIFRGRYQTEPSGGWLVQDAGRWRVGSVAAGRVDLMNGAPAALVVRPERIRLDAEDVAWSSLSNATAAVVTTALYLGSMSKYELRLSEGGTVVVRQQTGIGGREYRPGDRVSISWPIADGLLVADAD